MFARIEARISTALRRTAFGAAGVVLALVGLAFLTMAAWIGLAAALGAASAALVIGGAYLGLGCIFMAVAALSGARPERHVQPSDPMPDLVNAFVAGLGHGANARERYDHIRH